VEKSGLIVVSILTGTKFQLIGPLAAHYPAQSGGADGCVTLIRQENPQSKRFAGQVVKDF
jgi:hypothetical protein